MPDKIESYEDQAYTFSLGKRSYANPPTAELSAPILPTSFPGFDGALFIILVSIKQT
jgi:hypothetical protein